MSSTHRRRRAKTPPNACPLSNRDSTRFPGLDQCEHCGKTVRTRRDGTYSPHQLPKGMQS